MNHSGKYKILITPKAREDSFVVMRYARFLQNRLYFYCCAICAKMVDWQLGSDRFLESIYVDSRSDFLKLVIALCLFPLAITKYVLLQLNYLSLQIAVNGLASKKIFVKFGKVSLPSIRRNGLRIKESFKNLCGRFYTTYRGGGRVH